MNTQVETNPYNRESTADTVIAANNLNDVEPLLDIPEMPTDNTLDNTGGALEAFAEQETASIAVQQKKAEEAEAGAGASFADYIGSLSDQESVESLQFSAEQEAGVPKLEEELNRLNNDMLSEQRSLKRTTDRLNANEGGGLAGGVAAELRNAQRESYSKQADIAVVQMAAQGRHDSAIKWAQRKAAIEFGQQQRTIDIRKKIYDANKDLFDKEDGRLFQKQTNKLNNDLTTARQEFESLQAAKLDALKMAQTNNAPASVLQAIQSADTPVGVLSAGGAYASSDMLERRIMQANLDNIISQTDARDAAAVAQKLAAEAAVRDADRGILTEEQINTFDKLPQAQELKKLNDFKQKLNAYQIKVADVGVEMVGQDAKMLDTMYSNLITSYNSEIAGLGALAGADLELLEKVIPNADVGLWGGTFGNAFGIKTRKIEAGIEQVQTIINNSANTALEQIYARDAVYENSSYVQAYKFNFGDELITQAETAEMDAALGK